MRPHLALEGRSALGLVGFGHFDGDIIGGNQDFGIEQLKQGVEIALAGGGQEGRNDFPLSSFIFAALLAAPHPAAGAAGELAGGSFRSAHDVGDFLKGQVEQVVKHEGYPFGGSQGP